MNDYSTRLEVLRHHREDLLKEAENARLAREARRGRRGSGGEWRISVGRWILHLQRSPEYEASPAAKG
jgi:hypothetical protein